MTYAAVDEDGREQLFTSKPYRSRMCGFDSWSMAENFMEMVVVLPTGYIEKLIERKLTWQDEPVKLWPLK